ncbi:class I SAM-dependent methyltransferase [Geodermatophilus sp. SYSU D00691]
MTLVPLATVRHLLACPRCGTPLAGGEPYRCAAPDCVHADGFPSVGGRWPVIADLEQSVIDIEDVTALVGCAEGPAVGRTRAPAVLRRLVRPANAVGARQLLRLRHLLPMQALVLVVGGGTVGNGAELLYEDADLQVLAFDILPTQQVQLIADAHRIPLVAGCVDAVVVQAVLEHVLDPGQVVAEIHRVLRPEGLVYAETPFMQQVHAGCYDFTRFSDSGHRWLFRRFAEIDRGVVAGPGTALTWAIDHLVRAVFRSRRAGQIARLLFFWLRFADRAADPRYAADAASALYFLGRRAERPITPAEAVAGYTGAQGTMAPGAGTPSSE